MRCFGLNVLVILTVVIGFTKASLAQDDIAPEGVVHRISFEIAVIRPHSKDDPAMSAIWTADGLSCRNITLKGLIGDAYGLRQDQIQGGQKWSSETGYDLTAKVSVEDIKELGTQTYLQKNLLLRELLTDRFKLHFHMSTQSTRIYELLPLHPGAQSGLTQAANRQDASLTLASNAILARGVSTNAFAAQLGGILGIPIIDKTGYSGRYTFELHWSPEAPAGGAVGRDPASVFLAIRSALSDQLGLTLSEHKESVPLMVIDSVQRPTEN
jgi:uncharacterized protein (TIGR03435 family)